MLTNFSSNPRVTKSRNSLVSESPLPTSKRNPNIGKQRVVRPPLHAFNLFEPKSNIVTVKSLNIQNLVKSQVVPEGFSKSAVMNTGTASYRSSISTMNTQRSKGTAEAPKSSREDNDRTYNSIPVLSGRMLSSRSVVNENRNNDTMNISTQKRLVTEPTANDESQEAKIVLKRLFTSQRTEKTDEDYELLDEGNNEENKIKLLFQRTIQRKGNETPQKKFPPVKRPLFRVKNPQLDESRFLTLVSKLEVSQVKNVMTEPDKECLDMFKNKFIRLSATVKRPHSSEGNKGRAMNSRIQTEGSEERLVIARNSSKVFHSGICDNLLRIGRTNGHRRSRMENDQNSVYIRSRSTGLMHKIPKGLDAKDLLQTEPDRNEEAADDKDPIDRWYHTGKRTIEYNSIDASVRDMTSVESHMKHILTIDNAGISILE